MYIILFILTLNFKVSEMSCESSISCSEIRSRLQSLKRAPWHVLSGRELSDLTGVSLQVLANWRVRGKGPKPCPAGAYRGHRCYYRVSAIDAWLCELEGVMREEWEITADWLMQQYIFPVPLQCEERTWRVVEQLCRWNIYPETHRPRVKSAVQWI